MAVARKPKDEAQDSWLFQHRYNVIWKRSFSHKNCFFIQLFHCAALQPLKVLTSSFRLRILAIPPQDSLNKSFCVGKCAVRAKKGNLGNWLSLKQHKGKSSMTITLGLRTCRLQVKRRVRHLCSMPSTQTRKMCVSMRLIQFAFQVFMITDLASFLWITSHWHRLMKWYQHDPN